jgi:hypothetical protein
MPTTLSKYLELVAVVEEVKTQPPSKEVQEEVEVATRQSQTSR